MNTKNSNVTKIFFDTEFTGLRQDTTLISIGLISECGKTFCAEMVDYDKLQVTKWIQENVINKLLYNDYKNFVEIDNNNEYKMKIYHKALKPLLFQWLSQFELVEIWSDCLAYDWVLFNNIFGSAFDIPKNVYYIPFDICTLFKIKGIDPNVSREDFSLIKDKKSKHTSLFDAKIIKKCYERAMNEF